MLTMVFTNSLCDELTITIEPAILIYKIKRDQVFELFEEDGCEKGYYEMQFHDEDGIGLSIFPVGGYFGFKVLINGEEANPL